MVDLTDRDICNVIRAEREDAEKPLRAKIEAYEAALHQIADLARSEDAEPLYDALRIARAVLTRGKCDG